jgi:hypothetical protein
VVVAIMIVAATALQAGFAGVSFLMNRRTDERLCTARGQLQAQRLLLAQEREREKAPKSPAASRWQLLASPDVTGTMQMLQVAGDAAGISVDGVKATQSNTPGKQSFQLAGRGSPEQVCEFLSAIEQNSRLVVIESGRILPASDVQIAFELGLATYHVGGDK